MSKKSADEKKPIDHAIDATFDAYSPYDDEAAKHLKLLKGLHAIKAQSEPESKMPSSDTMLMVAGNLVGILLIVSYEHGRVMSSKGLQYIKSLR